MSIELFFRLKYKTKRIWLGLFLFGLIIFTGLVASGKVIQFNELIFSIIKTENSLAQNFNYVTWEPGINPPETATGDCFMHSMPAMDYPLKWEAYNDPVFNIQIRRFTDNVNEANSGSMNIQYTTFSISNSDNTLIAIGKGGRM